MAGVRVSLKAEPIGVVSYAGATIKVVTVIIRIRFSRRGRAQPDSLMVKIFGWIRDAECTSLQLLGPEHSRGTVSIGTPTGWITVIFGKENV